MAKREVTIYTCDGCSAQSTIDRDENTTAFSTVTHNNKNYLLCTICSGAISWVTRLQGITRPPRVYKATNGRYGLRRRDDS